MFTHANTRRLFHLFLYVLAVIVVLLLPLRLQSQKAPPPKSNLPRYDTSTEATFKGSVEEFKLTGANEKSRAIELLLTSNGQSLEVFVCPKTFLDSMGVSFEKGDALEITGSKIKRGDQEEVLARQIVKGNDTVVLRDKTGKPVW